MTALLAFDTATDHLSVALQIAGRRWSHEGIGGAQASAALIPAILALLDQAGATLVDLDAIAFGRGPGAFTGLRTACSVAQGLGFGAARPVLPIDSLLAVAEDARGDDAVDGPVWVTMDARMDQVYAACYQRSADGDWQVLEAPLLTTPEELSRRWRAAPPRQVAGNALTVFGDRLAAATAVRTPGALPRATALLALAERCWRRGEAVDAAEAVPLYLRDKVAQTSVEREAARALRSAEGRR